MFPNIKNYVGGITLDKKFTLTENSVNKMLEKRCEQAEIPKYHPHAFRHFSTYCYNERAFNGLQMKACSQNMGHEHISTTLEKYANMPAEQYIAIIEDMFENEHNYADILRNVPLDALFAEIQKRSKLGEGFK